MLICKQGQSVLNYHNENFVEALVDLFPEVSFDLSRFRSKGLLWLCNRMIILFAAKRWQNKSNQKKFFEGFAKERNFDPDIPENWYSVRAAEITQVKVSVVCINLVTLIICRAEVQFYHITKIVSLAP